jgi:predicted O-linked N-acetylglucosamine transferase (SPINDLY family)
MADSDVVDQMRTDNIDVLVDLAGHSADNRLGVLASRAAPVQASYLGYPNTTGLSAVDYYVTDDILDPSGASESRYSERLTRLSTFCCYEPPDNAPAIAPTPAANTDHVTFGGLHNLAKINTDVIRVWTRILHALPDSRLLLQSAVFTDPVVRNDWLERFAAAGIHRTRLLLRDHTNFVDHLRLHAGIDVALDVFPWSGHTATCHTLWMGVPVVALHGSCHAGRMAARVLRSIGLDELVAKDEQDYVDIAVALALDAARRNALRSTLRDRMLASPLCDAPAHVRELEAAYRDMWMTWCAKRNR